MIEKGIHWKSLTNPKYLGAHVLIELGTDLDVTITDVNKEIITLDEGKKEEHTIATLKDQKPWILNTINRKVISKVLGSPEPYEWVGKTVTIYAAKIRAFGENMDAIRVRPTAPEQIATKPNLNPDHENWKGWAEAIQAGTSSIEAVREHYELTEANAILIVKK